MKSEYINHTNYIDWFLCFSDNELTKAETALLMQFVADNPHLKPELDNMVNTVVKPDTTQFFNKKNLLKKYVPHDDTAIILYLDNELNETEKANFERSIDNESAIQISGFKQTYLQSDTTIVFSHKEKLYKKAKPIITFYSFLKFAASVLLLIGLGFLGIQLFPKKENTNQEYARHSIKTPTIKETENKKFINKTPEVFIAKVPHTPTKKNIAVSKKGNPYIGTVNKKDTNITDNENLVLKEIPSITTTDIALNNDIKIDYPIHIKQSPIAFSTVPSSLASQEKNKTNSIFNTTLNSIKDRVLNTLSGGGDEINVAFFAINTK